MQEWTLPVDHTGLVSPFALVTQWALGLLFAIFFLALSRSAGSPAYFRAWTRAWFARALALTAILVRIYVPLGRAHGPLWEDGSLLTTLLQGLYQAGKFLTAGWIVEGALCFAGLPLGRRRALAGAGVLVVLAGVSASLVRDVDDLLAVQALVMITSSVVSAALLLGLAPARRTLGTRLSGSVLLVQGLLWSLYFIAFLNAHRGLWPEVRTPLATLAAHNSYFDLGVDVILAASLVVLLLQDLQKSKLAAEAERSRLQLELGRTERLRSLGTLVSGVAHELNNPLTAILGFAESLDTARSDEERSRAAGVIREQALRCRHIVRGLCTFSGEESDVREPVDILELLRRVAQGFRFELDRRSLTLGIEGPPDLRHVSGDRFGLEQLFANLVSNAVQASPPGSRVRLSAREQENAVEIAVEDAGPGIPAEILSRLFDPFFTTKPTGAGMGLGLTVAHAIAHAHGGSLRAENREEGGARLVVGLPTGRAAGRPGTTGADTLQQPPLRDAVLRPARTGLNLLVIEDEPLLCEMLRRFGARRGWSVSTEDNGRSALELLRREGERFDVVLCDLKMAPPSGIEVHDRMLDERPQLLERFLFLTGDLSSHEAAAFASRCRRPILRKPFRLADLAARVESIAPAGS